MEETTYFILFHILHLLFPLVSSIQMMCWVFLFCHCIFNGLPLSLIRTFQVQLCPRVLTYIASGTEISPSPHQRHIKHFGPKLQLVENCRAPIFKRNLYSRPFSPKCALVAGENTNTNMSGSLWLSKQVLKAQHEHKHSAPTLLPQVNYWFWGSTTNHEPSHHPCSWPTRCWYSMNFCPIIKITLEAFNAAQRTTMLWSLILPKPRYDFVSEDYNIYAFFTCHNRFTAYFIQPFLEKRIFLPF